MIPQWLSEEMKTLAPDEQRLVEYLAELDQLHLFAPWQAERLPEARSRQLSQLRMLDKQYPGGLGAYVGNARTLLAASRAGSNPFAGYKPTVPEGVQLTAESEPFEQATERGLRAAAHTAFVLVAGGLGERLGYSGIKIALPAETLTGRSFVELYCQQILALQRLAAERTGRPCQIPLAIMTSGDTDAATRQLLDENQRFGLAAPQLHIVKQEKVPSLGDNDAHFAPCPHDPYQIETKPHGHGDVHVLLHQSGLARRWLAEGKQHIAFFQDTNALVFNALVPTLGIGVDKAFEVNTVAVPRAAGEAAGGIVRLAGADRTLTINVEYNQLDPLLRATGNPEGDVADATGYSPFPGNTNALVLGLSTYVQTLGKSGGAIPEFVNPKYADGTKTAFKKPTRLECMMQDYPRLLAPDVRVGFTQFERAECFSAVKNNLSDAAAKSGAGLPAECASTGEADLYGLYRRQLVATGADIAAGIECRFGGIPVVLAPHVVLYPSFAMTLSELREKVRGLQMTARSSLIINGPDIRIDGLELDGALRVDAVPGACVEIRGLRVVNDGVVTNAASDNAAEPTSIRGFEFDTTAMRTLRFDKPGSYLVTE